MEEARRAYKAERTPCSENGGVHACRVLRFGRDEQISDPFAGKRERFAERIADDGVVIIGCQVGNFDTAIYELPVRLIGNQENFMFIALLGFKKNFAKAPYGIFRQNDACGIIGGIDDDRLGFFGNRRLECREIDLKIRL